MTRAPNSKSSGKTKTSGVLLDADPEALKHEFATRMIVSAAGLPRICVLKKCRRRKRCFGKKIGDLMCLKHHHGLSQVRFERALRQLGWPTAEE